MAQNFIIDDGRVEFQVNGDPNRVFYFYPSDLVLFKKLDAIMIELKEEAEEIEKLRVSNKLEIDDFLKFDSKMREKINEAFGYNICEIVFGDLCLSTAVGKNHMPVFINFLEAIVGQFKVEQEKAEREMLKRTSKYTQKYEQQELPETQNSINA